MWVLQNTDRTYVVKSFQDVLPHMQNTLILIAIMGEGPRVGRSTWNYFSISLSLSIHIDYFYIYTYIYVYNKKYRYIYICLFIITIIIVWGHSPVSGALAARCAVRRRLLGVRTKCSVCPDKMFRVFELHKVFTKHVIDNITYNIVYFYIVYYITICI